MDERSEPGIPHSPLSRNERNSGGRRPSLRDAVESESSPEPVKILLVDDDESFHKTFEDLLAGRGYEVDCVLDYGTARDRCRTTTYGAVITEVWLQGKEDMRLLCHLAARRPAIPVIVLTSRPSLETALESYRVSACGYLAKSAELDELPGKIDDAVGRNRMDAVLGKTLDQLRATLRGLKDFRRDSGIKTALPAPMSVEAFVTLTLSSIMDGISDFSGLVLSGHYQADETDSCHLLACPRLDGLNSVIRDASSTLEKTKSSFRSRELKTLRERLDRVIGAAG